MNQNIQTILEGGNISYLESLYENYVKDANSVNPEWQAYFKTWSNSTGIEHFHSEIQASLREQARLPRVTAKEATSEVMDAVLLHERKQIAVHELINAYRLLGHLHATIDPLQLRELIPVPELEIIYHGLSAHDFNTEFGSSNLKGPAVRTLQTIVNDVKKIYSGTLAAEFMHLSNSSERWWLQSKIENLGLDRPLNVESKKRILECITAAEGLEKYLGAKYPGAKRFSLEGNDSLIVAIDALIQGSGVLDTKEVVIGMTHRGRLNVLINILGKSPLQLFDEFEGKIDEHLESGDVKYHQGYSSDVETMGGKVHLSLVFNPSHLEVVSPVVCGSVRARLDRRLENTSHQVLPIIMHGDAAFAGQGVVMETLNMSQTRGYGTGGTIHIIVNNQIGFTISEAQDARSTLYASDVAKMIGAPIFHVNCDDPEAVYLCAQLALEYRTKFNKDVVIDLVGYRRHGHNEADEPAATQPSLYNVIRKHPTVWNKYSEQLIAENIFSQAECDAMVKAYRDSLDNKKDVVARNLVKGWRAEFVVDWTPYFNQDWRMPHTTSVDKDILNDLAVKLNTLPEGFVLHPRVQKIIDDRVKMTLGELPMDWGYAENLAYASLLHEGAMVRISGQDSGRGTFFHRHAVLHNQADGTQYIPLKHIQAKSRIFVVDSLLSELAVLGFEYGFAATEPRALVVWEAQFGDFANGAQIVIDQFISSGEQKWGRLCGLTLLLPHGAEGMGPEHSSARLERYLQLCADNNMQVCVPTTPAQIFHLLRRQVVRLLRKPLIIMSPKSLLRHKQAVSTLDELSESNFRPIIDDDMEVTQKASITKIIFCTGKVYYELLEQREVAHQKEIALIRIEQLYPFPDIEIKQILSQYSAISKAVWCQEEPKNQGAWLYIHNLLQDCLPENLQCTYAGREPSASTAVGYARLHERQQHELIKQALEN